MFNKSHAMMIAAAVAWAGTAANASIAIQEDLGIFAPCDDALAQVIWVGSEAGYTGELSWLNTDQSGNDPVLWTNKSAIEGQSYIIPHTFAQGERVDFNYEIILGGLDFFSTANANDWAQFEIDASDPLNVLVGIEDIRLPGGDDDLNDAMFRVAFECDTIPTTPVPTPGSLALLGAGGLMFTRRRRA